MRLKPQMAVESRQRVGEATCPDDRETRDPRAQVTARVYRGKGFEIEAKVDNGAWKLAAETRVTFEPGQKHVIRFRFKIGPSTRTLSLPQPVTQTYIWETHRRGPDGGEDVMHTATCTSRKDLLETRLVGALDWSYGLEEVGGWGRVREFSEDVQRLGPDSAPEAFDEEGYVS